MASSPVLPSRNGVQSSDVLLEKLAAVLPKGSKFGIYHISTPPTLTEALFHAPPGCRADRTYCESHFLSVTIDAKAGPPTQRNAADDSDSEAGQIIVFALEIFVFTTAFSSTFFVSKADSSGYMHLLRLPKGIPSPIREVSSAFVAYLIEQRRRKNVQSIVSLFARSQSQYLFPGSVDNDGKHVLDDRGLVKWWCRVLDPLLQAGEREPRLQADGEVWESIKGYLVVPGLDQYETRAFLPRTPASQRHWTLGHPLEQISHYVGELGSAPPRCLVPQYPDDPKSRYLDELDDEAERSDQGKDGAWKSVKTLDQFWEMMAFRQECSSGRLTGFIWVVFNPPQTGQDPAASASTVPKEEEKKSKPKKKPQKKILKGLIVSRLPRAKTQQRNYVANRPQSTPYYYWPAEGRGKLLVDDSDYKRINELLLQLDFSTLEKSVISTRRWIKEAGVGSDWRLEVTGQRDADTPSASQSGNGKSGTSALSNDLNSLVKGNAAGSAADASQAANDASRGAVNVLGAGFVRKKRKDVGGVPAAAIPTQSADGESANGDTAPKANVLSAGLVRKKPKAL